MNDPDPRNLEIIKLLEEERLLREEEMAAEGAIVEGEQD